MKAERRCDISVVVPLARSHVKGHDATMRSRVTPFAFTLLILASASACETQVHLVGAVELDPNCEARSTNAPLARGLLDLGAEGTAPRDYLAALVVETDVERITFDTMELWYSADVALDA